MNNFAKTFYARAAVFLILACSASLAGAAVRLPGFFTDNMVLQRDMPVPVWGWGNPGETVTVEFDEQRAIATVDEFGSWMTKLKPLKASATGRVLSVNHIQLKNVLVGEVWICSGTENMNFPVRKCINSREELKNADYPLIRLAAIDRVQSPLPENDANARWEPCTNTSVANFSATGYFFARKLHGELGVPIGVIGASWGGTGINPWIPGEGYRDTPSLKWAVDQIYNGRPSTETGKKKWENYLEALAEWLPKARQAVANGQTPTDRPEIPTELWITNIVPTKTFNGMINPLIPYAIRGVTWDHADNPRRPEELYQKQKALIESWRKLWQQDFSFYFAQIPNSGPRDDQPEGGDKTAQLREQQQKGLAIANTGIAATIDIGVEDKRAAQNRQDVGARLALLALAKDYGRSDLVHSGPQFRELEIRGRDARAWFDHTGGGLMTGAKDGLQPAGQVEAELKGFAICGADRAWHWADVKIGPEAKSVILSSAQVETPVAVRYGYRGNPAGINLYNREGLPALPFRTDNF